jgi:hypothetical protein
VSQLFKSIDHMSKSNAKDYCAKQTTARQQAMGRTRLEYSGLGDEEAMRADTFTFDGGHLVKIDMVYSIPSASLEPYSPKSFAELFAGLQGAYGPPSKSYSEPVVTSPFGIKYNAHRAEWVGNRDVITIVEQPGHDVRTEIIAESLAEHNHAAQVPKTANPLQ